MTSKNRPIVGKCWQSFSLHWQRQLMAKIWRFSDFSFGIILRLYWIRAWCLILDMASQELNNAIFSVFTFSKGIEPFFLFVLPNWKLEKINHFQKSMNTFEDGTLAPVMPARCKRVTKNLIFFTPEQKKIVWKIITEFQGSFTYFCGHFEKWT